MRRFHLNAFGEVNYSPFIQHYLQLRYLTL